MQIPCQREPRGDVSADGQRAQGAAGRMIPACFRAPLAAQGLGSRRCFGPAAPRQDPAWSLPEPVAGGRRGCDALKATVDPSPGAPRRWVWVGYDPSTAQAVPSS